MESQLPRTSPIEPILSLASDATALDLGSTTLRRRIGSDQTDGEFSVVEFISQPGEGVGLHTHTREDELVYLLEGTIEVALGDQTMTVGQGTCALLPRNIPHGFINRGERPSRLLAILLPGRLDQFFVELSRELAIDRSHETAIEALCAEYGLTFASES